MIGGLGTDSLNTWMPVAAATAAIVSAIAGGLITVAPMAGRRPRNVAVSAAGISLAAGLAVAWMWHAGGGRTVAIGDRFGGGHFVFLDGLTAVMLPYVALVGLAILLVAPRRALEPKAVSRILFSISATLLLFCTSHPVAIVLLWIATAVPPWSAARATPGGRGTARVVAIAMTASTICMAVGTALMLSDPPWERASGAVGDAGGWLVAAAVMIREGIVPFHSWYPALYAGAPMGAALAATIPQVGAYAAVRLLVGHADGVALELAAVSQLAFITGVYGGALAVVQRDIRGLVGTLVMSQSAITLAGLSGTLPMELDGAFCVWISSGLALTGIGLVTWALESRGGDIRLDSLQGRFWDAPALAAFFLLFGLAAIGLPGTLSFVADDLIISGSLDDGFQAGLLVIAATVLAGIAVMRGWFHTFGGTVAVDGPRHAILPRERFTLSALLFVLFLLGLQPAPLVRALDRAAATVLEMARDTSEGPAAD